MHRKNDRRLRTLVIGAVLLRSMVPTNTMLAAEPEPPDEPLVTDRPDFTESTETIAPGRLQIEAGYTFTYDSEHGLRTLTHTAPELLLRIGVGPRVELRLGSNGDTWTEEQFMTEDREGKPIKAQRQRQDANDLSLGLKIKLFDQDGLRPHGGVIAGVTVPSGEAGATSGDVDPQFVWLWAYDLADGTALAGNIGVSVPTEDGHRFVQTSASLSYAFPLTDRLGVYVEYFGFYPADDGGNDAHFFNGGFTFLVNNDVQLDVRAGVGLNDEADDFFTGIGFARRF